MKNTLCILICLVLTLGLSVTAFASNTVVSISPSQTEIKDGATTFTVSLSNAPYVTSALVNITLDDGLSLVSGQWEKKGVINDFAVSNGYGVIAFSEKTSLYDTVFSFTVKGKSPSSEQKIQVSFKFKNGSSNVGTASATTTVNVMCKAHSFSEWTATKTQSCTEAGSKSRSCAVCKYTETQDIPATGHAYGEWQVNVQPNCYWEGMQNRVCATCGMTEEQIMPKTEHLFEEQWTVVLSPTCYSDGLETRACTICGDTEEQIIYSTHTYEDNWIIQSEPNCYLEGCQVRYCIECGSAPEYVYTGKLDHNFIFDYIIFDSTEIETGSMQVVCEYCGTTQIVEIPVKAPNEYDTDTNYSDDLSYPDPEYGRGDPIPTPDEYVSKDDNTTLYVVISIIAVLLVGAGIAVLLIFKKKKSSDPINDTEPYEFENPEE